MANSWHRKSISVIADCSFAERKYLFEQSKILKKALQNQEQNILAEFRINDPNFGIYEIFLESSTRTKESFRNAANFHCVSLSDLVGDSSSLNKSESFSDTFQTLIGYGNQIFIVRSQQEGLCRWLAKSCTEYCKRMGIRSFPAFINGGDGSHEHPTQELLDDFTFLEDLDWNYERIHIALIGDLLHGRTVHSKANGLQVFQNVEVDLIAPDEMALPQHYRQIMLDQGFTLRSFPSLDAYLEQEHIAPMWYFTRLQLERMDDAILLRENYLRDSVTLRSEHLPILQNLKEQSDLDLKFYHPLPRHKQFPVTPPFLDNTDFNAWERQSYNGCIVRIALLSLIAGLRPAPEGLLPASELESAPVEFCQELPFKPSKRKKEYAEGLKPIQNGVVIDHILSGSEPAEIRRHMWRITELMGLDQYRGGQWVGQSHNKENPVFKGLIFIPNAKPFEPDQLRKLAAIAPHITVNNIKNSNIQSKYKLLQLPRIYGFPETRCRNRNCISHPSHHEGVDPEFVRSEESNFTCIYCHTSHKFQEIWDV